MKYKELEEVIYSGEDGEQVWTYIKRVNEKSNTYILQYNYLEVSEEKLVKNTEIPFKDQRELYNQLMVEYYLDFNIDMTAATLRKEIEDREIDVSRDGNSIIVTYSASIALQLDYKAEIEDEIVKLVESLNFKLLKNTSTLIDVILKFPYNGSGKIITQLTL